MRIQLGLVFWLVVTLFQNAGADEISGIDWQEVNAIPAEQLILITYRDRNIHRLPAAGPGSRYRRRSHYRSSSWSARIARRLAADYHLKPVTQWPITEIGEHCVVFRAAKNQRGADLLKRLRSDARIDSAQVMRTFKTRALNHRDPYFPLQENLHWMEVDAAHRLAQGHHIDIALIDTSVDTDHPDLRPRIAFHQGFTDQAKGGEIHGTAIAGIISAQADNRTGIVGVAPKAHLLALQACWSQTSQALTARCNTLSLALALNTALKRHPRIINMSLTGPEDPLLRRLIQKAVDQGIVVVAAEPDGADDSGNFPASMAEVIAVRSTGQPQPDQDQVSHCLPAPGREILTTFPRGGYNFISGSSAATAQISGIIALMLELNPDLTVTQIRKILQQAVDHQPDKELVNAHAAVQAVAQGVY